MNKLNLWIVTFVALTGCSTPGTSPNDSKLYGLASPIRLISDTTQVVLSDYFTEEIEIDSVTSDVGYETSMLENKLFIVRGDQNRPVSNLTIYAHGMTYSIPVRSKTQVKHRFALDLGEGLSDVRIKGEFNQWVASDLILKEENGLWVGTITATPKRYQYRIIADNVEIDDPNNDVHAPSEGGFNDVLDLRRVENEKASLSTINFTSSSIRILAKHVEHPYAYWDNFRIATEQRGDTLTIKIPPFAKYVQRSYIRIFGCNATSEANDILIPLNKGKVVTDPSKLNSQDWHSSTLYFPLIDRFNNADPSNDHPVADDSVLYKGQYHGGDIKGITQKIKDGYFNELGINTLWISPITRNPDGAWGKFKDPDTKISGYHGYWPVTLTTVDYRLGNSNDVRELLDEAHRHGISVLLDYVANHVHQDNQMIQKHPEYATELYLPDGRLNLELWDEHRLTTWFDTFLPTLDLENEGLASRMVDSAIFWLETYDFDGIRHDATKHVPLSFQRKLTQKVKQVAQKKGKVIYQVGETYGDYDLVSSYIGSGLLDGQFDFKMYDNSVASIAFNASFEHLADALNNSLDAYGHHHLMVNITGNHDKPRFISLADGQVPAGLTRNERKRIGWKQDLTVSDSKAYHKLELIHAFNAIIPGIPVIYYGDELGMAGGDDPGCRNMMRFDSLDQREQNLKLKVARLMKLRSNNMALMYGSTTVLYVDEDAIVIRRKYFDNEVTIMINKGTTPKSIKQTRPNETLFDMSCEPLSYTIQIK